MHSLVLLPLLKRHPPCLLPSRGNLDTPGNRTRTSFGLPFSNLLLLDAALVNKLVPCDWLSSGALEISRLLVRSIEACIIQFVGVSDVR